MFRRKQQLYHSSVIYNNEAVGRIAGDPGGDHTVQSGDIIETVFPDAHGVDVSGANGRAAVSDVAIRTSYSVDFSPYHPAHGIYVHNGASADIKVSRVNTAAARIRE